MAFGDDKIRMRLRRPWNQRYEDAVSCVFIPVLAEHSKSFSLIACISVGADRMQRNFDPMRSQVEAWQRRELTDVTAKVVIYEAFSEGKLEAAKHLARTVHDLYFERRRTRNSVANEWESFERLHVSIQRTGSHSAIQGAP